MFSKIIKNGIIVDGTNRKPFAGDVAIESDKIVAVGNLKGAKAQQVIDATGKFVMPGFVDIQNHSDAYWNIFDNPNLDSLVAQGITSIVIGNCGASLAPLLSRDALLSIQKWHSLEGVNFNWLNFEEYLAELSKRRFGTNIASLVGYSTLRRGLVKNEIRGLRPDELRVLIKELDKSLSAGAFGLSTGLLYAHEAIITESEILELVKVLKRRDKMFAVHLRSEATELTESVSEALDILYKTGVNMKISHFKARNKNNWHLLPHALSLIEDAYQRRGGVHFDVYPYDFMWQVLYTYLPRWAYEGGRDVLLAHLKDEQMRGRILAYLNSRDINYSQIYITSSSMAMSFAGKTLGEIAKRNDSSSEQALLDVVQNGGSEVLVFDRNLDEKQVEMLVSHPLSIVASDGGGFAMRRDKLVHPRCFGSMPQFLSMVFAKNLMPVEQAVQKISSIPAQKVGLKRRGMIFPDYFADLVVVDREVKSVASYENPFQFPKGVEYVLVNGRFAVDRGVLTQDKAGTILRS